MRISGRFVAAGSGLFVAVLGCAGLMQAGGKPMGEQGNHLASDIPAIDREQPAKTERVIFALG